MTAQPVGLLLFRLAGRRIAIDLGVVAEVSEIPSCWPIPLVPSCFIGVINFHGALVPVLDLAMYLKSGRGLPQGKVMVLDKQLCDLALWVDGVERITGEDAAVIDRIPEEPFMQSLLQLHEEEIPLLDAAALLDALEADLQGLNHSPLSARPV
jgi:chemotaxis signal transduction protein